MENKKDYVTPQVEIILVEVERGFAGSTDLIPDGGQ